MTKEDSGMKRILISLCIPFLVCVFAFNSYADDVTISWGDGTYVGEVSKGIPDGQGTFTHANGAKYVGEFKNGKPNGQGTYTFLDGTKYVGEHKNGFRHGQGTSTSPGPP